jgi:hypothetical protein
MKNKKLSLGVVIYTHNRVDDARINIELIKSWKSEVCSEIKIAHAYNGKKDWYKKTKEDFFVVRKNLGHQQGAADLIDKGIEVLLKNEDNLDYILVLAADTWLVKPDYVDKVIRQMQKKHLVLATASWGSNKVKSLWAGGLATDFFVVDAKFSRTSKLFPLNYMDFSGKYKELLDYLGRNTILEHLFSVRLLQALERSLYIPGDHLRRMVATKVMYRMKEREPVHIEDSKKYERNMYYPKIHLLTHHDPKIKKNILKKYKITSPHINKLLKEKKLDYYNGGHVKNYITLPSGEVISMH